MKLIASLLLALAMLTGCQRHSDEDYAQLEQKYNDIQKEHHALDLERESKEAILETAIACNTLPINICPQEWTKINIASFQNAGYIGQPTWRYWLILCGGVLEKVLAMMILVFGFRAIWKTVNEPDPKEVTDAKETIKMAKEEHAKLNKRINEISNEETRVLEDIRRKTEAAKKELSTVLADIQEQQVGYEEFINGQEKIISTLRAEVLALEQQKKLFGG